MPAPLETVTASLCIEAVGDDVASMPRAAYQQAIQRSLRQPARVEPISGLPMLAYLLQCAGQRPVCAEISGYDGQGRYQLRPLRGERDYTLANDTGSRGIYVCYRLEAGCTYMVQSPQAWAWTDVSLCTVTNAGQIIRCTPEEADLWL